MTRAKGAGLAAAILALGACDRTRATAERAVRAFDEASIRAYRTGDTSGLPAVAGEREVRRIVALVDLKTSAGVVLESDLRRLRVTKVERGRPDAMTVEAEERWSYHDRAVKPGIPAGRTFLVDMTMAYALERGAGGAWKVADVRTIAVDYLEPKGFRPGDRGHGASPDGAARDAAGARAPRREP